MAKSKKSNNRLSNSKFSPLSMLVFLAVFAVAGFAIYRLFAASTPGLLEAEELKRPASIKSFADQGASGGRAIAITKRSAQKLVGSIQTNDEAYSLAIVARSVGCRGAYPTMAVSVGKTKAHKLFRTQVRSLGWKTYEMTGLKLAPDTYTITLGHLTYSTKKKCQTKLYIDSIQLKIQPASVTNVKAEKVKKDNAKITATIDTKNKPASYYAEYGLTNKYGTSTEVKKIKKDKGVKKIEIKIKKLQPSTTYHFRVCTVNDGGTTCTQNVTFTTPAKS